MRGPKIFIFFSGYQILFRPKSLILAFSFHKNTGKHILKKIWDNELKITFKIHISQNLLYRLSVSVSADMEKFLSVIYRYRPIRKFILSVVIGIGRYGKKHIDRTLRELLDKSAGAFKFSTPAE